MARRNNVGNYGGLYGGDARGLYSSSSHRNMMIYGKPPRKWPKIALVVVILLIIIGCIWQFACGGLPFLKAKEDSGSTQQAQQSQQSQQQSTQGSGTAQQQSGADAQQQAAASGPTTTLQISAVGDCTLGTDPNFDDETSFTTVYDKTNAKHFFKRVTKYTSNDNLTLANLEGALTNSTDIQEKSFNFKGPGKYADILVEGSVEAVNLANNHSYDYGEEGYEDTKKNLSKYKVTSFGYDRTAETTINGIKVGLFGINQLSGEEVVEEQMLADIESLKDDDCALIIGMFHWGVEGNYTPEESQVDLAHAAIDEGCDLVIGGHPHVLQGVELYKDRYICYSMGNFVFGGNDNPRDTDTMIFQETFAFQNGELVVNDKTLRHAQVIPCSLTSSSTVNNYQPLPLGGKDAKKLLKSLNGYSKKLEGESVTFTTTVDDNGCAQVK